MQFIFFGNDWFAENRTSSHHIAARLGAMFPLLYVEVPGLRAPKANARDFRKLLKMIRATFRPPQQLSPLMWRMTLPQIPLRRLAVVRAANRLLSRLLMRRALHGVGFKDAISWFHVPHAGFLAGKLKERMIVYYCIDDYSQRPDVDEAAVRAMDDELARAAHIVFACNERLLNARRLLNSNIHLSPHGVDVDLFAVAMSPETPIPEELKLCPRPIIGCWGLLDQRIDLFLLEEIARARPQWTIVLIGYVSVDVSRLKRLPNVIFAGVKPYAELPGWARAFDICILPYTQTLLNAESSPLKLREYLAAGKPVVAVPLPEAKLLGDVVKTGTGGEEFVSAIEEALSADSQALVAARRNAVAAHTWDQTVANVLAKLREELSRREEPAD